MHTTVHPRRRAVVVSAAPLLALVLAACGGGSTPKVSAPPPSTPAPAPSSAPGVFGTAAAVSNASVEVQSPTAGQVTVDFSASTLFTQQRDGALSAIVAGSCLSANGTPSADGAGLTARTITVTQPVNGACTSMRAAAGAPFGGGPFGAGPSGGPSGSRATPRSPRPRPSNGDNETSAFSGKVTGVSGTTIMVTGTLRNFATPSPAASPAARSLTITTDQATRYTVFATVDSSALKVGECVAATGPSNDIGVVSATAISIFSAGPNGCFAGQGQRGGSAGPRGAGAQPSGGGNA